VSCPIFSHADECFCLHENCRYYTLDNQGCSYSGGGNENLQMADNSSCGDIDRDEYEKSEQIEAHTPKKTEETIKLSAKELWDRLSCYNRENGISRYDTLINELINVVKLTKTVHYLTPMSPDFWFQKIEGLESYRAILEN
jgi:hypothetical protein